ncbi:pyrroloquinoline quinone biosynthesis peptide chaperone PqqD [Paramixta manurensis]|uniref:PqqA binding protein n=1 Tax=Paramixta manurensis TaxID=2740817 RepID=A0A6M8U3C2_9GAMM|nr:pyrroloquinoline quinone biosynthesis peptide chaperone PqqD [Erwiniaceae bacterium PD-1]
MEITSQQLPAFRRGFRLQWEQAQNSHVMLYPEGMAKLNESAAAILQLVDGKRRIADIIAELEARFPDAQGIGDDVKEFFGQAYEQKWIIFSE